jgi:hypothetical protein
VALAALEALRVVDPTLTERLAAQRAQAQATATPREASSAPERRAVAPANARPVTATRVPQSPPAAPTLASRPFTRLTLGVGMRHFIAAPVTTLLGLRLELSRRFSSPFDLGLDVDGTITRRQVTLGTVDARLLSTAAWLGARAGNPDWSATAGLGGRVGLINLVGSADEQARGHRVLRPLAGALLIIRGDGAVGPLALAVVGEGGYALAGAQGLAGGEAALRLDGVWLAISANAGVRW